MLSFEQFASQLVFTKEQKESISMLSHVKTSTHLQADIVSKDKDEPIDTTQQFLALYAKIEEDMIRDQEHSYRWVEQVERSETCEGRGLPKARKTCFRKQEIVSF
jgi:hypothetical protein